MTATFPANEEKAANPMHELGRYIQNLHRRTFRFGIPSSILSVKGFSSQPCHPRISSASPH